MVLFTGMDKEGYGSKMVVLPMMMTVHEYKRIDDIPWNTVAQS
jgi:hypothetical protein